MVQKTSTLYKLIVLYMLDRVSHPLTTAQIGGFVLEKDYTDFLTLQQAISELADSGMILAKTVRNRTHLSVLEEGRRALRYFVNRMDGKIKEQIDAYLRENEFALRRELSVLADYTKNSSGEYEAHLAARDGESTLVELTLFVPAEEMAAAICDHWQEKNQEIYQYLTRQLF
jgi:hypothetical protein